MKFFPLLSIVLCGAAIHVSASPAKKPAAKSSAKPATKATAKLVTKAKSKPTSKPAVKQPVRPTPKPAAEPAIAYQNDLEKLAVGKPPAEFMVLSGGFSLAKDEGNTVFELPGEPVDAFGLLFGPTLKETGMVKARGWGTSKGRRTPAFGVGIFGISGWKLQVTPAARQLTLLKDEEVKTTVPYEWRSGTWTWLRLQVTPVAGKKWKIEGRAWPDGTIEPDKWMIEYTDSEEPPSGRASLLAMPYAGTPLRFDDLSVGKAVTAKARP